MPWPVGLMATLAVGGLIAVVTASGVRVTAGASSGEALAQGIVRGVMAAIPFAVALYACRQPASARFGRLLLAQSIVWALALLSSSSIPVVYSAGRVCAWINEAMLVYVLLAFPSGRLTNKFDRALVGITAMTIAMLYLPTALLVHNYPVPVWFASCQHGCPHNAFMVSSTQPGIVGGFIQPLRETISVVAFMLVAVRLMGRLRGATAPARRSIAPVLATAAFRFVVLGLFLATRRAAPASDAVRVEGWILAAAVPVIALAFLAGMLRLRLFVSTAIVKVSSRLGGTPGPQRVRDVVAEAFEDPELQIGCWLSSERERVGADGRPLEVPALGSGRHVTEVRDGRRRTVVIIHDEALRDVPAFIEATANWAAMAFEGKHKQAQSDRILQELKDSRARILAAADDERRRIERDLHDSAQQRLVALRIELEIAAEQADDDPAHAAMLRELGAEVEGALDEIRSLTRGIYPALLDRSLEDAIRATASRCPLPTAVEVEGLSSYPQDIAVAVYFCVAEALQNVAKHAHRARSANVEVRESGNVLRFSVSDDGEGFLASKARVGAGMIHMKDRMATVGGELKIRSRPGQGTEISGEVPLSPSPAPRVPQHAPRVVGAARQRRGATA